jgi:hypothetical protein
MHLANGTLANDVCTLTAAISTASSSMQVTAPGRGTPSMVVKAAIVGIVLMAQMIGVPLFNGMSAHVIGAAFLTLLAGPARASPHGGGGDDEALALNDGGITALCERLNMGVVGCRWRRRIRAVRGKLGRRPDCSWPLRSRGGVGRGGDVRDDRRARCFGVPLASALSLTMPAHAPFAAWKL